jgi:hypothetical protein
MKGRVERSCPRESREDRCASFLKEKCHEIFAKIPERYSQVKVHHRYQRTPLGYLELQISPRIFEKIRNGLNGILRGLGETDL